MSNRYFDVTITVEVAIPMDQVTNEQGTTEFTSKEEAKKALLSDIIMATKDTIKDGIYDVDIDQLSIDEAVNDLIKT